MARRRRQKRGRKKKIQAKGAVRAGTRGNAYAITHAPKKYNPGTRHIRATHGGHAGQKGGWLGALFSGLMTGAKAIMPHVISAGAQVGAQAASGAIQAGQQEAAMKRSEDRQRAAQREAEERQRSYAREDAERAPSPRRRSPSPSPYRRRSPSPRRRSPSPRRYRSPSPRRYRSPSPYRGERYEERRYRR